MKSILFDFAAGWAFGFGVTLLLFTVLERRDRW